MALDYDKLMRWPVPEIRQNLTARDTILYALGVGLGADPLDEKQLRFVYEERLLALPTMAVVLGYPGFWMKDPGVNVDWKKILHGEQGLEIKKPLPTQGTIVGKSRITGIVDKGKDKGALVYSDRDIVLEETGEVLATLTSTSFLRGDGGNGGGDPRWSMQVEEPHALPTRAPDAICDLKTLPQAALIYRLSGDYNPLHADPAVAKAGGFPAPILHGLCSFGVAGHAVLKTMCDYDPARLKSFKLRFSSPVYPGETIRTEMWKDGNIVSFRARVLERDVVVLNNGCARID
jgi:acyl dehydratase